MKPHSQFFRVVAILVALTLHLDQSALAQPAGIPGMGGPSEVGVITLTSSEVPYTTTVPGRAVAFETVDVRPRVSGVISEIIYEPGATVAVGDLLFRIESETYAAEVASAQAEVAQAEGSLESAQATVTRYEGLVGTGITTEELEAARVTALQAAATLSAARAALQVAQLDLERTEITSPIAGVVDIPAVSVGALVTANQTDPLTTVTRIDPIYVDVEEASRRLTEIRAQVEAGSLRPGEQLDIRLRLETGEVYNGEGRTIAPGTSVSETTGTLAFRLAFENPERRILPGQFLRVDLTLGTVEAILVPQGATSRASTGELTAFVAVDGVAEQRTLTERGSHENAWIVTGGVEEGELLIVDGLSTLRAGAEVSTVPVTISEDGVPTAADGRSEKFERPAEMPVGGPPGAMPGGAAPPNADSGEAPDGSTTPDEG